MIFTGFTLISQFQPKYYAYYCVPSVESIEWRLIIGSTKCTNFLFDFSSYRGSNKNMVYTNYYLVPNLNFNVLENEDRKWKQER